MGRRFVSVPALNFHSYGGETPSIKSFSFGRSIPSIKSRLTVSATKHYRKQFVFLLILYTIMRKNVSKNSINYLYILYKKHKYITRSYGTFYE